MGFSGIAGTVMGRLKGNKASTPATKGHPPEYYGGALYDPGCVLKVSAYKDDPKVFAVNLAKQFDVPKNLKKFIEKCHQAQHDAKEKTTTQTKITLVIVKQIAIQKLSAQSRTKQFLKCVGEKIFDEMLIASLYYFMDFFAVRKLEEKIKEEESDSNALKSPEELNKKIRRLRELKKMFAKRHRQFGECYSRLLLDIAEKYSRNDKTFFEAVYLLVSYVVWISFGRKHWTILTNEISRLFRSEIFMAYGYRYDNPERFMNVRQDGGNSSKEPTQEQTAVRTGADASYVENPENPSPVEPDEATLSAEKEAESTENLTEPTEPAEGEIEGMGAATATEKKEEPSLLTTEQGVIPEQEQAVGNGKDKPTPEPTGASEGPHLDPGIHIRRPSIHKALKTRSPLIRGLFPTPSETAACTPSIYGSRSRTNTPQEKESIQLIRRLSKGNMACCDVLVENQFLMNTVASWLERIEGIGERDIEFLTEKEIHSAKPGRSKRPSTSSTYKEFTEIRKNRSRATSAGSMNSTRAPTSTSEEPLSVQKLNVLPPTEVKQQ
eukprot:Nk52_evm32s32 gene=Nk52_evmTU32s32